MNIVLTVGSLPYPFDRVVRVMDDWAERHPDHPVYMQIGYSTHRPAHAAEWFDFAPFEHFQKLCAAADVLVAHGSAGPILEARRRGLPLIQVPRQKRHGECYNDHQVEICQAIRGQTAMHELLLEMADFDAAMDRAMDKRRRGQAYEPHLLKQQLVATMADFVESLERD